MNRDINIYIEAAKLIKRANHAIVFTGSRISVDSGIPIFRGKEGLLNKIDPALITGGFILYI